MGCQRRRCGWHLGGSTRSGGSPMRRSSSGQRNSGANTGRSAGSVSMISSPGRVGNSRLRCMSWRVPLTPRGGGRMMTVMRRTRSTHSTRCPGEWSCATAALPWKGFTRAEAPYQRLRRWRKPLLSRVPTTRSPTRRGRGTVRVFVMTGVRKMGPSPAGRVARARGGPVGRIGTGVHRTAGKRTRRGTRGRRGATGRRRGRRGATSGAQLKKRSPTPSKPHAHCALTSPGKNRRNRTS